MAPAVMALGTGFSVYSTLQQGKDVEEIAEDRARIDEENAKAAERLGMIKADRTRRRGKEAVAGSRVETAAGNIIVGTGASLQTEARIKRDVLEDIGFIYETSQHQARQYRASAELERKRGKMARRQSYWDAISTGVGGLSSMAELGMLS